MLEGWKGVVVIVAGLTLLGVMVALKVPEAATAAVSVLMIVVAWVTKSPNEKPPPGANVVPWVAGAAIAAAVLSACLQESRQLAADATYEAQQLACVDKYDTRTEIDRCRQKVKAAWSTDAARDGAK